MKIMMNILAGVAVVAACGVAFYTGYKFKEVEVKEQSERMLQAITDGTWMEKHYDEILSWILEDMDV